MHSAQPAVANRRQHSSYDVLLNHLTSVQVVRAGVTQNRTFTYNSKGQLYTESHPESGDASGNGLTTYTYNDDGTLATRKDPAGQVTAYAYDYYKRVSQITHKPNGTTVDPNQTYTFNYDQNPLSGIVSSNAWGRRTAVQWGQCDYNHPAFTEEFSYDVAGNTTSKRLTAYKTSKRLTAYKLISGTCVSMPLTGGWSYDNEGRITKIDYPGGSAPGDAAPLSVSHFYDANGRPLKVESSQGACANVSWASKATYNEASQLTSLERFDSLVACGSPNSIWNIFNQAWQYNVNSQLIEIDTSAQSNGYPVGSGAPGAANVYWQKYYYSATKNNGQVTQVDDARLGYSMNYTYDSLSRLAKADAGANWVQTYGYDGFGNLTSKSTPPGSSETPMPAIVSAKNRLGSATYDLNGNVTSVDTGTYSYDVENRLVGSNDAPLGISYDEANRRVEDGSLYFYSPDGQLLATFQENLGATPTTHLLTARIYFGGMIVGEIGNTGSANGYSKVLTDRLGSTNPTLPYGGNLTALSAQYQKEFATYSKGPGNLNYAMNRFYHPGYGRFLTTDPMRGSGNVISPHSFNRFAYTLGDPINKNDPSGRYLAWVGSGICTVGEGENAEAGACDYYIRINPTMDTSDIPGDILLDEWFNLSLQCRDALKAAMPGGDWANVYRARVKAVNRAFAASKILKAATAGTNISWQLLAAIGVRETAFRNVNENDGTGVGIGVFQFTVSDSSGVTAGQALNLSWAANSAVTLLTNNADFISNKIPGLSPDTLNWMMVSSWNTGAGGQVSRYNNKQSPDYHTAPYRDNDGNQQYHNDYGSNVLNLMDCFN